MTRVSIQGPFDPWVETMTDIQLDKILILDFGSQYTQLIARRIREAGVFSEIRPWDISLEELEAFEPSGIILSGGPESVTDTDAGPKAPNGLFDVNVPVLGICYGCLLYTSPSPRDRLLSRMPSSA